MTRVGGEPLHVPQNSGYLNYSAVFSPADPNTRFFFSLGNSGVDPDAPGVGTPAETTGMHFLTFSGESGKLYDNDENYIHSYNTSENLKIDGNVFTGYHNYFINNVPINLDATRRTGVAGERPIINAVFLSGIKQRNFSMILKKSYGILP